MKTHKTATESEASSVSRHSDTTVAIPMLQRKEQDNDAERLSLLLKQVQPKLNISNPEDPLEKEAELVAGKVMRVPDSAMGDQHSDWEELSESIERKPTLPIVQDTSGREKEIGKKPFEVERLVQRKIADSKANFDIDSGINTIRGSGQSLSESTRSFFELRFGYDFSGVRVHSGEKASELSHGINAKAFTLGSDIVFGAGRYAPETGDGKRLIAHELTHVVQQGGEQLPRVQTSAEIQTAGGTSTGHENGDLNVVAASTLFDTSQGNVVQRQPVPTPAGAILGWRGVSVSANRSAVRMQLEQLVERGGLGELESWALSFLALDINMLKAVAIGSVLSDTEADAIKNVVSEISLQLRDDGCVFVNGLRPSAESVTNGILDASKERIEKELDHYGIREEEIPPKGGGGAEGSPSAYEKQVTMDNLTAGHDAQAMARELTEFRQTADAARQRFMKLAEMPGKSAVEKVIRERLPDSHTEYQAAEETWKMTEDLYAKRAMAGTKQFPILAIYATGPSAAAQLAGFAAQPPEQMGETIWREARTRLDNIETVRGELGGRFNPLFNKRILDLTLAREDVKPWQKRVGRDYADSVKEKAESDEMFWTTIAIGLGLIAAIPTGGVSVAASAIGTAALVAGTALSIYNVYEQWNEYNLQSAAAKTDFAKAEALAKDEPSFLWLAIGIIGTGLELGAAAFAFKGLVAAVKEARTSRDVLKMAEAVDSIAPPSIALDIKAKVVAEIGPEKAMEMVLAEGEKFRCGDLTKIRASLEQAAIDGWSDAYDALASQSKIRPLTEDALEAALSHLPSNDQAYSNLLEEYIVKFKVLKDNGIYSPETGIIFIKPGSQQTVASVVAHEFVHAGQAQMGQTLNSFWAEFEAYSAQKRLIHAFDKAGVGGNIGPEVSWLRNADDAMIAKFINKNYGYPIPSNFGGVGTTNDRQVAFACIEAAKRVLAVGAM
ncbi:MAG: DUF4157 domain-containing protein [Pseudomonadota bacterium]